MSVTVNGTVQGAKHFQEKKVSTRCFCVDRGSVSLTCNFVVCLFNPQILHCAVGKSSFSILD